MTFCCSCAVLVAMAFSVYALVLSGLLWHFNVSVVSSVCCGVCLFGIMGGVSWFAAVLFGLLRCSSVCCHVFLFALMLFALHCSSVFFFFAESILHPSPLVGGGWLSVSYIS